MPSANLILNGLKKNVYYKYTTSVLKLHSLQISEKPNMAAFFMFASSFMKIIKLVNRLKLFTSNIKC